jgi:uncharacterized protein
MSPARRTLIALLVIAAGIVAALTVWLLANESRMVYFPIRELEATPARLGLAYEDVALHAEDGVALHGWFVPAPATDAAAVTVLFLHGNGGNVSHRLEKLAVLNRLGAAVLLLEWRGYGRSAGSPSEAGLQHDARAAYDHLVRERGVDPRRLVVYGESLGSAHAAWLATEVPVGGVVLESAFTSARAVARRIYPWLPVAWVMRHRMDTLARMPRIAAPVLLLQSRDDEFFPYDHAERLAAAARDARLVELRGGHNDAFLVSGGQR